MTDNRLGYYSTYGNIEYLKGPKKSPMGIIVAGIVITFLLYILVEIIFR